MPRSPEPGQEGTGGGRRKTGAPPGAAGLQLVADPPSRWGPGTWPVCVFGLEFGLGIVYKETLCGPAPECHRLRPQARGGAGGPGMKREKDSKGPGGPQLASPASPWAGHLSSVNDRRLVGVEGSRRQKQHRGSHGRSVKIRTKETQTDPNRTQGDQNHSQTGTGPAQVAWDGAGSPGGGAPRVHGFGNRTAGHSSKTGRGDTESLPLNPKSGQGAVDPGPQESGLRSGSHIGARSLWG